MIEVQGLTKRYGANIAIDDVSFVVKKGEVVGFLGPNGAGKSTTMRVIAGSLGASSGTAKVDGVDVAEDPRTVQAMLGYSPEVPPLYTNMTVRSYVRYAASIKRVADVEGATNLALSRVGLTDVAHRLIDHLSKGYRQRVGLAQALVHDPKVLVLDEPTSGLDPAQRVEIRELIRTLAAGDRTIILSTHVLGEIEAICNRVIFIGKGRILAQDDIGSLSGTARMVRVEVARPEGAQVALAGVDGVVSVEQAGPVYTLRTSRDVRAEVAAAAVPFGLLALDGKEHLEEVYLRLMSAEAKA